MARVGSSMNAQDVGNLLWAYGKLEQAPGAEAWSALEAAVVRVALDMVPQAISNSMWSYATLGRSPGADARAALEAVVVRAARDMTTQGVSNTFWAFATLGLMPGAQARAALTTGVVRVARDMRPQEVSNTLLSYSKLGLTPGPEARVELEAAVERVAPDMVPQAVANTLWSLLALAATRGVPLPACYPSLWRAACGIDAGSSNAVDFRNLFHAHLIYTELVSGEALDEVTFPPWIMHEARDAWMREARDYTVSMPQREVASIIGDLGIRYEVERLTDDGYFSVDVYLPDFDVALEFDGPSHFIDISDGGKGAALGGASRATRTVSTELRDMFLARRHRAVLSVPWFEYAELNDKGAAEKAAYIAAKLRDVIVSVSAPVSK